MGSPSVEGAESDDSESVFSDELTTSDVRWTSDVPTFTSLVFCITNQTVITTNNISTVKIKNVFVISSQGGVLLFRRNPDLSFFQNKYGPRHVANRNPGSLADIFAERR